MLGLFWMAVANGAILLGAHEILRRVRTGIASLDATIFILIRLVLVSLVVLVSLCTRTFNATALGVAGATALALLLATGAHRRLPSVRWPDWGRAGAALGILILTRLALQVWFFAPSIGDVTSYHLPKIGEWVTHGRLTLEFGDDFRSAFPAGFELVEAWWVIFLHHDVLIEAAGIEFQLLAFAAAFALARWIGLTERGATLAAFLYVLVPGIHLQATNCLNDGPLASVAIATAALIAARAPLLLIVMAAGLAAGIKPTFVYIAPGLAVLWLWIRKEPAVASPDRRWPMALAAAGILLGGFWYGRNTVVHGNPLHPMSRQGILGPDGKALIPSYPSLSNLKKNFTEAVNVRLSDRASPYSALSDRLASWGAGPIALGLPALIPALRENRRLRRLAAAFTVSVALVFMSVYTDPWYMRFIYLFPLIPCLAAAWLVQSISWMRPIAGAALALQFLGTFVHDEMPNQGLRELASMSWRDRKGTTLPADILLPDGPVGCMGMGHGYPLYGPGFTRRVIYLRSETAGELKDALRRESITLIYANPSLPAVKGCVADGWLQRQVGHYFKVVLPSDKP